LRHRERLLLFFISIVFFTYVACEKEPTNIGMIILPEGEEIQLIKDSVSSISNQTFRDSLNYSYNIPYGFIGSIQDPIFGLTKTDLVSQFLLSRFNVNFPEVENIIELSLVLGIHNNYYYGDTTSIIGLNVYELETSISEDNILNLQKYETLLGNYSGKISGDIDSIKIPMDFTWAEKFRIISQTEHMDSILQSNTNFINYFKGIFIESEEPQGSEPGATFRINLDSDDNYIYMKYNESVPIVENGDTTSYVDSIMDYRLIIGGAASRGTIYHRDYSNVQIDSTITNDTAIFLQGIGGFYGQINFGDLPEFYNDSVTINDAELVLNISQGTYDISDFRVPVEIQVLAIDDNRVLLPVEDYYFQNYGAEYFDDSTQSYRFNITRFIQSEVKKAGENTSLIFRIADRSAYANRGVFYTGDNGQETKIYITYSKF